MGQIVGRAAKPKRCNLNKLSQLGSPAAGEHILVSSDNSMNAAGQGNFDAYVVGDGHTAATALPLQRIDAALEEEVSQLGKKVDGLDYTEVTGKYIKPNGTIGDSAAGFYTSPIPVKAGETLTYSIAGAACAILSKYDNGSYIPIVVTPTSGSTQYTNQTYTATEDCYVVFSGTPGTLEVSSSMNNFDRLQLQINETNNELLQVRDELVIKSSHQDLPEPITGNNYVESTQTIGNSIVFGSFGSHSIFAIPANSKVTININSSGGSYGFVLADVNDKVLEYCSNSVASYTFKEQTEPTKLYVSSEKFRSGYYVNIEHVKSLVEELCERTDSAEEDIVNIKEQLVINHHNTSDIRNQYISQEDGYITNCAVGKNISECFGPHSKHNVYKILAGYSLKITMLKGGAYQFALCDSSGYIIEYCTNMSSQDSEYQFAVVNQDTWLYASESKIKEVLVTEVLSENVKDVVARLEQEENVDTNYWYQKNIWWCGTSIPAGSDATIPGAGETIAGNYPTEVGNDLGCMVINKSVGGSMCRANVRTGDYVGANFANITSALTMTKAEIESFITNYSTIKDVLTGNVPSSLSTSDIARLRAASFEDRLIPYLDGTYDMPDLFVFDHGHNDYKYSLSGGGSDIGLEPTVANIGGELAEDTYMIANDNAKLESFFGSLANIPSSRKAKFIASLNRNCYIGAVNFLVTLILRYNPHARIVFISNYEYENGDRPSYAPLIPAQKSIADSWAFPLCEVYKSLGYSNHIIPGSKDWFNATYPAQTPATTDVTVYEAYLADSVHPHSDITGDANNIYAGIISEFIKRIR